MVIFHSTAAPDIIRMVSNTVAANTANMVVLTNTVAANIVAANIVDIIHTAAANMVDSINMVNMASMASMVDSIHTAAANTVDIIHTAAMVDTTRDMEVNMEDNNTTNMVVTIKLQPDLQSPSVIRKTINFLNLI